MFENLLQKAIKDNFIVKNKAYIIEPLVLDLLDFHEVSENKKKFDLGERIFVFERLFMYGRISTIAQSYRNLFVSLISNQKNINLRSLTELKCVKYQYYNAICEVPSVHNSFLDIKYDNSNFIFSKIYWANITGAMIISS